MAAAGLSASDAIACAEIDAAGKLNFDSSQVTALKRIAQRTELSSISQAHLVSVTFHQLRFSSSQMMVLQSLINNPSFANAAKQGILANLSRMSFDSDRLTLLRMINDRGELSS